MKGTTLDWGRGAFRAIGKDRNIWTMIMEMEYFLKTSGIRMDL